MNFALLQDLEELKVAAEITSEANNILRECGVLTRAREWTEARLWINLRELQLVYCELTAA